MNTFRFTFSIPYAITFLLLLIVMMELHEMAHISVGRLLCGCWGPRDFNVWSLCEGCQEKQSLWWLATLMGPVFSFAMMWLGMIWLGSSYPNRQAFGFSLIFANIPFGRITTAMMGGGDEMVVVRHFLKEDLSRMQLIMVGSTILLALGLPPIISVVRVMTNRRPWLIVFGFLTLPLAFLLVYTLMGLNTLLSQGFLAEVWAFGTPLLITLHTTIALIVLIWLRKNLFLINSLSHDHQSAT